MAQVTAHTVTGETGSQTHVLTLDDGNTITVPVTGELPADAGWGQVLEAAGHTVGGVHPAPVEGLE